MLQKILAPLRGFTDSVFRTVWATHFSGLDYAIAPFVATSRGHKIDKLLSDLDPDKNKKLPVIPQILSNDVSQFIFFANKLFDRGYSVTNWNLGCPFSAVVRKTKGAGLLKAPDRIASFLETVLPQLKGHLSIKMRLGWESPEEFDLLLSTLTSFPLEHITVHARTGKQGYTGTVDIDTFSQVSAYPHIRWIYNGDIFSPQQFQHISNRPNVQLHGIMMGRGLLENPFLLELISSPTTDLPDTYLDRFRAFHEELFAEYEKKFDGPGHLLDHMKGFWGFFANGFMENHKIRKEIYKMRKLRQFHATVNDILKGSGAPRWGR